MTAGFVFTPAWPVRVVSGLAVAAALALGSSAAYAQAPAPTVPAPKATPRPVPPAQKAAPKQPQQPAQAPAPQAPAGGEQQAGGQQPDMPPIVFSPWTKFCGKDNNQTKDTCLTLREARLETGQFLAGAALIEQQGEEKKLIRVTLPLMMQLPPGARLVLDKEQPLTGRYIVCTPNGCMADFEVNAEFVGKLKKGQQIVLQAINLNSQPASFALPLADFAKANDGPPTDPKKFEEDQKKLQEELQKKAEKARDELQKKGGAPK